MRIPMALLVSGALIAAVQVASAQATDTATPPPRKAAIIVENHAGTQFDSAIPVLEEIGGQPDCRTRLFGHFA